MAKPVAAYTTGGQASLTKGGWPRSFLIWLAESTHEISPGLQMVV
jgi:hypothetical protein